MDITRLPVTTWSRPTNNLARTTTQPANVAVEPSETTVSRQRSRAPVERVLQGELLERNRHPWSNTLSFLNERGRDQASPVEREAVSHYTNRGAISQYLNHAGPESVAELTQGKAVDYFI